jgi:Flp pilus assembly protein TadD/predicted Ser/Thr protein kinase
MAVMETGPLCQHCGKPLGAKAVQGLCPECFMKVGLGTESPSAGDAASKPSSFIPPTITELAGCFPQLDILELIGRGGMGAVYKARQKGLDRLVALKILPPDAGGSPAFTERFAREARALAQLNHANIVAIYDFGHAGNFYFLLMEFVDGVNLRQMLHARRLSPRESMSIVPQVCEALQFAHDHGIVHRDIKPENVLVDRQGRVKIADFGLARLLGKDPQGDRLTRAAEVMGTPHYMAPEQVEKPLEVDHRADIYSLGVVFYEMLTGELPLGKFAVPSKKVQVDVRLDEIVLRALEKEPALRYQQAIHVSTAMETCSSEPPILQPNTNAMNTRSHRFLWAGAGFVIAIFLAIAFAAWFRARAAREAAHAARAEAAAAEAAARAQNPAEASRLAQEGWQLWQSRRLTEAEAKFRQAVKLAPEDANAWNGLGWACFNSGKSQEAEKAFQTVLKLEPTHPAALNGLGQIYLSQRKYDQAETWLLKAAPQAPAAWYGLARLYLIQGNFPEAEKYAQKVVDSGQGDKLANKMLEAAQDKNLTDGLRAMIEPKPAP